MMPDTMVHSTITDAIEHIKSLESLNIQHGETIVRHHETIQNQDETIKSQVECIQNQDECIGKLRKTLTETKRYTGQVIGEALLENKEFLQALCEYIHDHIEDDIATSVFQQIEDNATLETTISFR